MKKNMSEIVLCGNPKGRCCPVVTENEYGYVIQDDFGGEVHLTREEMAILKKEVKVDVN